MSGAAKRKRKRAPEPVASEIAGNEFDRELRRFFRHFAGTGCVAALLPDGRAGLFRAPGASRRENGNKTKSGGKPLARMAAAHWALCQTRGLVEPAGESADGNPYWRVSDLGRARYRRLVAAADPFRAQHQIAGERRIRLDGNDMLAKVNQAETPLGWLRSRKGADGKPLISGTQYEAGEKLRADFTLGQLSPRVTADWSGTGSGGKRRGPARDPAEIADHAMAARQRVGRALDAAGPGLCDILLNVCCHLEGLEAAEKEFGWPKRSAKLVLQIALDRLAAHYGMGDAKA
tara:strand:+ start:1374 stop:2243 length:870 start_codon:yes stop_codon:yes gene_type:complete